MFSFTRLTVALTIAVMSMTPTSALPLDDSELAVAFQSYIQDFNKTYASDIHMGKGYSAFKDNLVKINDLNAIEGSEVYGLTKYSDMSAEEFKSRYLTYKTSNDTASIPVFEFDETTISTVPSSVDWRSKGMVTPVKDQGQCGSCWAFSATEAIESAWLMAGNKEQILAPQQIVSCDRTDQGCNGGDTPTAYKYVMKAGGMVTEKQYPYTSGKSGASKRCSKNKLQQKAVKIKGFKYATKPAPNTDTGRFKPNENAMAAAMAQAGPVSVCVDAETWQSYKRGVVTRSCKKQLDHCVQAVGYNKDSSNSFGKPYWIVRNSWNTDWGYKGYIYVGMGSDYCGIANEATIAEV